ncbi:MAG: flagellar biosynthetic protein FliO [Solirubrobacteraceae bacterium]
MPFHRPRHAAHLAAVVGCALACSLIALLVLMSGEAHGQAAASTTPSKGESTPLSSTVTDPGTTTTPGGSSGGGLVRTIVGLAIVIGVIYGITWVLKQTKKKVVAGSEDDYGTGLEPTAMLTLAGRAGLHLVRVGNEFLLLGVSDNGVNHLRSYTEDEARAAGFPVDDDDVDTLKPIGRSRPDGGAGTPFVERLRDLTVRR